MPDMLVKLYELPDSSAVYKALEEKGIRIIRPMTPNKYKVHDFVVKHFHEGWANEIDTAFTRFPVSCFIAYDTNSKEILGFAGYDCTYKAYFGPTGVRQSAAWASARRSFCAVWKRCATRATATRSSVLQDRWIFTTNAWAPPSSKAASPAFMQI